MKLIVYTSMSLDVSRLIISIYIYHKQNVNLLFKMFNSLRPSDTYVHQ